MFATLRALASRGAISEEIRMPRDAAPLSPNESRILVALADGAERDVPAIARDAGLEPDQARSAIEGLKAREHVEQTGETVDRRAVATERGRRYAESGLPELAILRLVAAEPSEIAACQEIPGFDRKVLGTAFGQLRKSGLVAVAEGKVRPSEMGPREIEQDEEALRSLVARGDEGIPWEALPTSFRTRYQPKKRGAADGLVDVQEKVTRTDRVTAAG